MNYYTPGGFLDGISRACPHEIGTRLEITAIMPGDPAPIPVGTRGTVTGGNGSQVFVDWDNGRRLILLTTDRYRVVTDE